MGKKLFSSLLIVLFLIISSGFSADNALAASITSAKDVLSRLSASTLSNHEVTFVTPTGVAAGKTITLTFSGFSGITNILYTDVDFAEGDSSTCSTASYTEKTLANSPLGTTWGVGSASSTVTITSDTGTVTANRCVRIRIGTNATYGASGSNQITNGSAGTSSVTIGGTFGDSGIMSLTIVDSDQVSITASVNGALTFDIDVGTTIGDNSAPYTVALGTLSSGSVTRSNTSTVNQIFLDGSTNSSGGLNVSVGDANGADGLVSTSATGDKIPSASGTMAAGTANYGLCVDSSSLTGWSRSTSYNTTCTVNGATNTVVGLNTSPDNMLTSTAPLSNGHAQVQVNAAISTVTPAHTDYTDTLTFIATASY